MKFSKIQVTAKRTRIGDQYVNDPLIRYEGRTLLCSGDIPASIGRLIPHAWGRAKEAEWQPLVERAIVLGLL